MSQRHPHVVNLDEIETHTESKGERFGFAGKWLGQKAGGKAIGCSWYEIAPGRTAFPRHYHCANEESVYILEGEGTARLGGDEFAVRPGDYLVFPVGPDHAHGLFNTGRAPLRYLCFSTLLPVEVVGYPDSNKLGFSAHSESYHEGTPWVRRRIIDQPSVDYYEGEKIT